MTAIVGVLIGVAALPAVAFPIVYAATSQWYGSLMGRGLLAFSASLALVMMLAVTSTILGPDFLGRPVVRLVVYGLVAAAMWTILIAYVVTVVRVRRRGQPHQ